MKNFRTYAMAKELYKIAKTIKCPQYVQNQLLRACLSIPLNLAEGNERHTEKDKRRFFFMALTSLREVQSIVELEQLHKLKPLTDSLGACLYKLCHSKLTVRSAKK